MAENLEVDPNSVGTVSSRLLAVGQRTENAAATVEYATNGLDGAWGRDDEVARSFATEYVPGRREVIDGANDLAQFLLGLGRHVRGAGHSFGSVEDGNT